MFIIKSMHLINLHFWIYLENQPQMKHGDFQLKRTTSGLRYLILSEGATKNHPEGVSDNEEESNL